MFRTVLALLLALLSSADAVLQSSDSYSFDSAYADAVAAKVECFISNAWPPLEAISSSFKMDFSSAPRADSPSQVHDNITKALLFYTFRSTPAEFDGIFVGFENAKFINLRRSTARLDRNIYLWYIKDENSTCGKPYNISSYCTLIYENSTSPYNGAVGKPSGATSYNTRSRPWYIGAKADTTYDGTFWTDVYGYAGGGIGITAAQQLLSSSGSLLGVAGIEIKLTQLSSILSGKFVHENLQNVYVGNGVDEPTFTAFIVDASGNLVSASQDGYSFRNDSQVPAYNCSYKTVRVLYNDTRSFSLSFPSIMHSDYSAALKFKRTYRSRRRPASILLDTRATPTTASLLWWITRKGSIGLGRRPTPTRTVSSGTSCWCRS